MPANARAQIVGERNGMLADAIVGTVRIVREVGTVSGRFFARLGGVITALGWSVLAVIPVAFSVGYLAGWLELVVTGWAALVLAVLAALVLVGRDPYEMSLVLPHHSTVVGEHAYVSVTVRNPHARRTGGTVLEVPVGAALVELAVPGLRKSAMHRQDVTIPTERRGVIPVGPIRTVRADPLALVRREVEWTETLLVTVHPRTVSVPSTSTGLIRDLDGSPTRDLTSSDIAFHALREYQPGDDRRYIHWRSTAKTGRYMVRQFEQTRRSHLVITLSLATEDFASEAEFELAVSVAGSLGVRAVRDGQTVSVAVSTLTPAFAKRRVYAVRPLAVHSPSRLLDDLATVELDPAALPVRDVARVVAEETPGVSVVFVVCGSRVSSRALRAAASLFPVDAQVVMVVCDPEAEPGLRAMAGYKLITLGHLEELGLALSRSAAMA